MDTMTERHPAGSTSNLPVLVLGWLAVGLPLLWGVYETLIKAVQLFH